MTGVTSDRRDDGALMIKAGPNEKIYPVVKLATVVNSLEAEGVPPEKALERVDLSKSDLMSPATRVSLTQVIRCCHSAVRLSPDRHFAYRTGLRFHLSAYGMYGFAILSSTNFRQTMYFAVKYHQLATPLADIGFKEEGDHSAWTIVPLSHPDVDAALYKFLVEIQFGAHLSLHRDVMGPSFHPRELHVTYAATPDTKSYPEVFGCPVLFGQAENKFVFDAKWLDGAPDLGNEITYESVLGLCNQLMDELQLRAGLAGKVREVLLGNLARPMSFDAIATQLKMTTRTLRRKLGDEDTSFRKLMDELRMQMAIKYLRDTDLTMEDIALSLGFSDAANFRHAFRRWTNRAPNEFRLHAGAPHSE